MKNRLSNSRALSSATVAAGLTATMFAAVTAPAAQAAGGETPATATVISNIVFSDSGTTVGFANNIGTLPSGIGSPYTSVAGPDVFYTFTVATGGTINITVTPSGGYDMAFYLLKDGQLGSNAVQARDSVGSGGAETMSGFALVGGSTYYLGIDSFYPTTSGAISAGTYSLTMSGTAVLGSGAAAPEPGTFGLAALGAGALLLKRRNRKR